jgi:hypothetical protein
MSKLRMDLPISGGIAPPLVVKVERRVHPPMLWAWKICEEGRLEPLQCSTRFYRCAEDAWAVGHAMLDRLPKSFD